MIELLFLSVLIAVPAGIAFFARAILRPTASLGSMAVVVFAAAIPAGTLFLLAQGGDAITAAASFYVMPVVFGLLLIPALVGWYAAKRLEAVEG